MDETAFLLAARKGITENLPQQKQKNQGMHDHPVRNDGWTTHPIGQFPKQQAGQPVPQAKHGHDQTNFMHAQGFSDQRIGEITA